MRLIKIKSKEKIKTRKRTPNLTGSPKLRLPPQTCCSYDDLQKKFQGSQVYRPIRLWEKFIYSSLDPIHSVPLLKFGHVATSSKTQTALNQHFLSCKKRWTDRTIIKKGKEKQREMKGGAEIFSSLISATLSLTSPSHERWREREREK